jgi:protein TonB
VFPGYEQFQKNNTELKNCMSLKFQELIATNFNYAVAEGTNRTGLQQIYAIFTINKRGELVDIKIRAPH